MTILYKKTANFYVKGQGLLLILLVDFQRITYLLDSKYKNSNFYEASFILPERYYTQMRLLPKGKSDHVTV